MTGRRLFRIIRPGLVAAAWMVSPCARAEEGGSGHYVPWSMASFADSVPPEEAFVVRYNLLTYDGAYRKSQPLPFAGLAAVGIDAESLAQGVTLLWRPPVELAKGLSYALSATVPWVWMDVSATVQAGPGGVTRSDCVDGLGDIVAMPLMLSYAVNPDLSLGVRLGFYMPTGDYETGRLANPGKNYLTTEPTVSLIY